MNPYTAVGIAEGFVRPDSDDQFLEAWQYLHDSGLAYSLQGFFARRVTELIDAGLIQA